jgi:hypothetical protein
MATVKTFRIEKVHSYTTKGWFTVEAVSCGQDNSAVEANEEYNRQLNEAIKQNGPVLQVLEYKTREWGGCTDEFDKAVDRHYVIESTVLFSH